ncbi:iron permease, partial [Salmonella enterica subsp. enterica]|nr:iron permease [Salmonella enterica subsp. enterica serovar Enteritidis]
PQDNPLGLLLHILVGYVARPEGIQVLAYAVTVALIVAGSALVRRMERRPAQA